MADFSPYDLLKNDLTQSFEHDIKVQAMQNIIIVALSIGEEKTKQLLKNLSEFYTNQPEEVVVALACRIGDLLRVTSVKANEISEDMLQCFLNSVDGLSNIGSQHVNDGIAHSFKKFISYYVGNLTPVCTFIQTLSASLATLQRSLCATLIPVLYSKVDTADQAEKQTQKQTLGQVFGALVQDQDALVRQECAKSVKILVEQIIEQGVCDKFVRSPTYIFACFDRLIQDLADQVRATNVENGIYILRLVVLLKETIQDQTARELREVKEILPQLIKSISRGSSDRYWRIRYKTALLMPVFFEQIHKKLDVSDCAIMHRLLTEDVEQDIRIVSIQNSDQVLQYLDSNTCVNVFVPALNARVVDTETAKVKCQLAKQLSKLIIMTKQCQLSDEAIQTLISAVEEIARKLLQDKDQEVRFTMVEALSGLYDCHEKFVVQLLSDIYGKKDQKWLVRNQLIKTVDHCISQGAQIGGLVEDMLPLLTDQAYEVRENAAELFVSAGLQFGIDWLNKKILGQLLQISKQNTSNYQNRIACCLCVVSLLKVYQTADALPNLQDLQKQILQFTQDSCVYVRNQVVERIHLFYQFLADLGEDLKPEIKKLLDLVLTQAVSDEDEHVKALAEELKDNLDNF